MKKAFLLILTMALAQQAYCQAGRLIGSWGMGEKQGGHKVIEFNPDKTAVLNIEGREIFVTNYEVEAKADPVRVRLTANIEGKETVLYILVEFIHGNTLKMEVFPPGSPEPEEFSSAQAETQIILTKVH